MEKHNFSSLLEGKFLQVPDYLRGYVWDEKQWKDFVQDVDMLIDDKTYSHYMGTIIIHMPTERPTISYGCKILEVVELIDGQQRLTTCSLYLSIILAELIKAGKAEYKVEIAKFLFSGAKSKLKMNNDTEDFYYDLISTGNENVQAFTVYQRRLLDGFSYLKNHLTAKYAEKGDLGIAYLENLFYSIISKLNFSFYPIEAESEIGMILETINSRGKDLFAIDFLKNRLVNRVCKNLCLPKEKENPIIIKNDQVLENHQFENYLSGTKNACLIELLKNSILTNSSYSSQMFLVVGAIGVGKTHLAQAYWNYIKQQDKSQKPYYCTATTFLRNFVEAIVKNEKNTLLSELEQYDAFIFDDIQHLNNKEKSQAFLIEIIEHFLSSNKPVLVTSSKPLKKGNFDDKLLSLVKSGLIHKIKKAGYETRLGLLKAKANALNITIEEHLTGVIAAYCKNYDARNLNGILNTLNSLKGEAITYQQVKATLKLLKD